MTVKVNITSGKGASSILGGEGTKRIRSQLSKLRKDIDKNQRREFVKFFRAKKNEGAKMLENTMNIKSSDSRKKFTSLRLNLRSPTRSGLVIYDRFIHHLSIKGARFIKGKSLSFQAGGKKYVYKTPSAPFKIESISSNSVFARKTKARLPLTKAGIPAGWSAEGGSAHGAFLTYENKFHRDAAIAINRIITRT